MYTPIILKLLNSCDIPNIDVGTTKHASSGMDLLSVTRICNYGKDQSVFK